LRRGTWEYETGCFSEDSWDASVLDSSLGTSVLDSSFSGTGFIWAKGEAITGGHILLFTGSL
jgi:hypothetical protein